MTKETEDGMTSGTKDDITERTEDGMTHRTKDVITERTEDGITPGTKDDITERTEDGMTLETKDDMTEDPTNGEAAISQDVPETSNEPEQVTGKKTRILGFLCNWCAYAGADLAGVSRVQYPPDMRVIRVMCSGRIDPVLILKAFRKGSDGVAVLGCHPGDCHYQIGNYQAMKKIKLTLQVLKKIGIEPERLLLDWVSAAEGTRFGEVVTGFIDRINDLGPIDRTPEFEHWVRTGETVIGSDRIRWLNGKELELIEDGNVYGEKLDEGQYDEVMAANIDREFDRERIRSHILDTPKSAKQIAGCIDIPRDRVFRYLTEMENTGEVVMTRIHEKTPYYLHTKAVPPMECA